MDIYGLIGFPLAHSFSAKFFTEKFRREGIDAEYINYPIEDIIKIKDIICQHQYLRGLNVTIPYKEKVIPFLNEVTPEALKIGAVNVIKIERNPNDVHAYRLIGHNTDYIGFKQSLLPLLKCATQSNASQNSRSFENGVHKQALILGTGGASKAVGQALTDLEIEWRYVSRSKADNRFTYSSLSPEVIEKYTLIVNASPVGTFPNIHECPDIPYKLLTPRHLLYDLIYNPSETLFMQRGKSQGATTKNGQEMLELQALAAWDIWQGTIK